MDTLKIKLIKIVVVVIFLAKHVVDLVLLIVWVVLQIIIITHKKICVCHNAQQELIKMKI